MAYDKKSSTITITTDDPKDLERDIFSYFAHVVERIEGDRANEARSSSKKKLVQQNEPHATLREALLKSYQPREMIGQECFFCGRTGLPLSSNLLEYYHDSKFKKAAGLVPTSEARGRVRGYMPICVNCAQRCSKCGLPVRTRWVERMADQVRACGLHLTVRFGQGFCRHLHPIINLQSYLKPLFRINGNALASEECEVQSPVHQPPPTNSNIDRFISAMVALGSPKSSAHLQKIGEDAMSKYSDPYIAALEATKIIVDGVVLQSNGEHDLLAHLMKNNCMGVVSLFLQNEVEESVARQYFKYFNDLPRRALGLRPEAISRLPTFEQTIGMVRTNQASQRGPRDV